MATSKSSLIAEFSAIGTLASAVLAVELAGAIGGHTPNGFQYAAASGSFSRIYRNENNGKSENPLLNDMLEIIKKFVDSHGKGELQATLKVTQGKDQQLSITYNPPNLSGPLEQRELVTANSAIDRANIHLLKVGAPPIKGWAAVQLFNDFYKEYHDKIIQNNTEMDDI